MSWHSVLRHSAASREVAGSISDGFAENFHLLNTSGRTVTLGLTHPIDRNEYHGCPLGRKGGPGVGLTTF
jgi:hypothetical protein